MSDLLEQLCDEHIQRSGASLWGRSWSVIEEDSRKQAAAWLAEQVRAVYGARADLVEHQADQALRYRRKYLAERQEVQRLSLQVRELKASLLRLLSPDLGLRDDPAEDALGEEEGCAEDAEQDDQSDEAEDEVHRFHGISGPMTLEWLNKDNAILVRADPHR